MLNDDDDDDKFIQKLCRFGCELLQLMCENCIILVADLYAYLTKSNDCVIINT